MSNVIDMRPSARNSDPITSHMADKEITLDGTKEKQLKQVYEAVKRFPGCTSREIANMAGLDRHLVGRRLSEHPKIKKLMYGNEEAKRKCIFSGRMCCIWDLV